VSEKTSEKTSEKVLQHIASNPYATIRELAERVGKEPRTIERALTKLKDTGSIKRIGSDKEGYWEIL